MVITHYGSSCFKVQSGETVVLFDPPSKDSGFKAPRFRTDVVFLSKENPEIKSSEDTFVLDSPGEYEIKGMFIRGAESFADSSLGSKNGPNTIFKIKMENTTICHLGSYGEKEFRGEIQEFLDGADVLFLPVGGEETINPEKAVKIINQIEPKIIFPIYQSNKDNKNAKKILKDFLKEIGQEGVSGTEKCSFKKKDIVDKKREVVVLNPLN